METVQLQKGQRLDLTKGNPGLSTVISALGWDERKKTLPTDEDFDPDVSMIALHEGRPFENPKDLLYYNSNVEKYDENGKPVWIDKARPFPFIMDGVLRSSGDERTGGKEGDDEVITVELAKLAPDVSHLVTVVTIYEVEKRKQNFGMMTNAFCRIEAPGIAAFTPQKADLTEDYSTATAFIPGFFYRKDGHWKYNNTMLGISAATIGNNGKPIGDVDLTTIALNLTAILNLTATAVPA